MDEKKIPLVRGFRDLIKDQGDVYNYILSVCREVAYSMGFSYASFPVVEEVQLFKRGMEFSDLVNKEMFLLSDDKYCLRPEITASAVRALSHTGDNNLRMMYDGPCFRYERPQKGRYRQFFQFGCEFFGEKFAEMDMFILINRVMKKLGINYKLIINDIGTAQERRNYECELAKYIKLNYDSYSADSRKRYDEGRYLRILDSKVDRVLNNNAPRIRDFIADHQYFESICNFLQSNRIEYAINSHLVRGLDYYNGVVFELISEDYKVDSQQVALGGGGRYDDLASWLGAKQITYGCGFALGIDRLMECVNYTNDIRYNLVILRENYSLDLLKDVYSKYKNLVNLGVGANAKKFSGKIENIIYVGNTEITIK